MPNYGRRRRRTSVLQVPRVGAFRQVLGDAALLAARQSRRLADDVGDDTLSAVLAASRRFRRLDRRTCTREYEYCDTDARSANSESERIVDSGRRFRATEKGHSL